MFDEQVFLWSLTARPEDARILLPLFKPEWLEDPVHQVILQAIFKFLRQHKIPPDLTTLEKILKAEDEDIFNLRIKPVTSVLKQLTPALPEQIYVLDQAKDVAIVRSLNQMVNQSAFQSDLKKFNGKIVIRQVANWLHQFEENKDEITLRLDEATERIVKDTNLGSASFQMPSNIGPIDDWTHGGLRSKQLGIFIAPTGHGKSAALMNIAYNMTIQDEVDVWFITNELTIEEQTERFLSRITGVEVNLIQNDPYTAYHGMGKHWKSAVNKRLLMTSVNREITTNDIENMMLRHANLYGWKPKVICLDFMERMKPNESGYDRSKEWNWIGAIAKDLVRLAKRHNLILWTAAQTNRAGFSAEEMTLAMAQASVRHLQEATVVIGMRKIFIEGEEDSGEEVLGMEFTPLKMRHGKTSSKPKILKIDLAKMRITHEEVKRQTVSDDSSNTGGPNASPSKKVSYKQSKNKSKSTK